MLPALKFQNRLKDLKTSMGFNGFFVKQLLVFFLMLSLIFPSMSLAEESQGPGYSAFQQGLQLREQGSLVESQRRFTEAVRAEPDNYLYHFELGNVLSARYDSWSHIPNHAKAQQLLEHAGQEYEQAVLFKPDFVAAQFNLGIIRKRQGKYEKAREHFKEVLEIEPNSSQAWLQIGNTYEEQGFFDEAEDAYRQAKQMDYSDSNIQNALEDLDEHRAIDQQNSRQEYAMNMNNRMQQLNQGLYQESEGALSPYDTSGQNMQAQSAGMTQALPYLASMLVNKFMTNRKGDQVEEE